MSEKTIILIAVFVSSTVGGYLPVLWGGSLFSFSSVFLSAIGGVVALYFSYKAVM
ncbi:MAG: hypothetical protein ABI425_04130 [Patescibacteria group bacterium]